MQCRTTGRREVLQVLAMGISAGVGEGGTKDADAGLPPFPLPSASGSDLEPAGAPVRFGDDAVGVRSCGRLQLLGSGRVAFASVGDRNGVAELPEEIESSSATSSSTATVLLGSGGLKS